MRETTKGDNHRRLRLLQPQSEAWRYKMHNNCISSRRFACTTAVKQYKFFAVV